MHSIAGLVIDRDTREPVGNVEVVLLGPRGELTTKTAADGTFKLAAIRDSYRAFVRDARVMSTGMQGRIRLRTLPRAELAGAGDEKLMPVLDVDGDTTGVELTVTVGGTLDGFVTTPDGDFASDVVVTAIPLDAGTPPFLAAARTSTLRNATRPVLGTDTAISDVTGRVVLRVPAGSYTLLASHPKYAGVMSGLEYVVAPGDRADIDVRLEPGCEITGRVVRADKKPVHDGSIETGAFNTGAFLPSGRVDPDGTFRWSTTETAETLPVSIRAWPWKASPSPPRRFDCASGKRFANVVLTLPWDEPDLSGTLSDARGNPVPLAYLDISPLDDFDSGQQERADASGVWHVYSLSAGRYQISASAAGRGIVSEVVSSPRKDVALRLSGVGRLAGTTTDLVEGSFELTFHHCGPASKAIELDDDARIVVVRGGRFAVDNVPACTVSYSVRWRDRLVMESIVIEPDRTAYVELALGTPRQKRVHGIVRDDAGTPVPNARITALVDNREATTVRSDEGGRYTLETNAGAQLIAGNGKRVGRGIVGRANVASEQVDIDLVHDAGDF